MQVILHMLESLWFNFHLQELRQEIALAALEVGNNFFFYLGKYLFVFIRWGTTLLIWGNIFLDLLGGPTTTLFFLGQYLFVFIRLATTLFIWGNIYLDLLGRQQQGGGEALQREAWIHCQ